jgi:ADP-ribose pyrophosphatase YjhB (NUDIX family)
MFKIEIPKKLRQGKDITHIFLVDRRDEKKFVEEYSPVNIGTSWNVDYTDPAKAIRQVINYTLEQDGNVFVSYEKGRGCETPDSKIYRIPEQKEEGRNYVGVGVGAIIKDNQDRTLLLQRSGISNNRIGTWDLPGGTVEYGQTLEQTLVREVKEETGLDIRVKEQVRMYEDFIEGQHWINFAYTTEIIGGYLDHHAESYKFSDKRFVAENDLGILGIIDPQTIQTIKRYK